jgi:HEAT repeat protein
MSTFRSFVAAAACTLMIAGAAGTAHAGRGGSAARIRNAIATGSSDAIIAEIERAERLVCSACVEPVEGLLDDERYEVREVAAWWMARRPMLKVELTERSITDLAGSDAKHVRNAADILGTFRHPQAIPALNAAAARSDLTVEARVHIVKALGTIGDASGNAGIEVGLADQDATVRSAAIDAWLAIRHQQGAAPLVPLIGDSDAGVRARAAAVAGSMREASARAALETRLSSDPDPMVRRNAAWSLGRLGDAASRSALQAASRDPSSLVRNTAKVSLSLLR